jgi:hypothetical protein
MPAKQSSRKVLAKHITLSGPTGQAVSFAPGDDPPDWARQRIRREELWKDADEPAEPISYEDMTVKELIAKAKEREIEVASTDRDEITQLLEEWDASH